MFCWGFQAAPNAAAAFSVRPTRHNVNGGVVLSLADKQRRAAAYLLVRVRVRPEHDRVQSCAIALRSPTSKRSPDEKRYSPDIHASRHNHRGGALCGTRAALRRRMLFLAASASSFIANGPQGLSPHGWVLFGERAAGHPLYAHHGAGSLNTHRYDATWLLRLLDSDGTDITDAVQRARADAPEGEAFWLGCCGADPVPEYLLPQLAGSYFERASARRVEPRVVLLPGTSAKRPLFPPPPSHPSRLRSQICFCLRAHITASWAPNSDPRPRTGSPSCRWCP